MSPRLPSIGPSNGSLPRPPHGFGAGRELLTRSYRCEEVEPELANDWKAERLVGPSGRFSNFFDAVAGQPRAHFSLADDKRSSFRMSLAAESSSGQLVEKEVESGDAAVAGD